MARLCYGLADIVKDGVAGKPGLRQPFACCHCHGPLCAKPWSVLNGNQELQCTALRLLLYGPRGMKTASWVGRTVRGAHCNGNLQSKPSSHHLATMLQRDSSRIPCQSQCIIAEQLHCRGGTTQCVQCCLQAEQRFISWHMRCCG
jgi:hypothetical protein